MFTDGSNIVIASYDQLRTHINKFLVISYTSASTGVKSRERVWGAVVIDEAHLVKNPASKTAKSVFQLKSHFRIAISGTPIQNNVSLNTHIKLLFDHYLIIIIFNNYLIYLVVGGVVECNEFSTTGFSGITRLVYEGGGATRAEVYAGTAQAPLVGGSAHSRGGAGGGEAEI